MKKHVALNKKLTGFTLIEVMVVIVLVGVMASVVQFTASGNEPEKQLQKESERFAAVFNIAAEYSLLNNVELGLVVEDNIYQFLGFDGEVWNPISENEILTPYTLPEDINITLILDGLPLDEVPLINVLKENEESDLTFSGSELNSDINSQSDKQKKLIPQVYILSGGDLTPFSLHFDFGESVDDGYDVSYKVTGLYFTPVEVEGPLFNE